MSRKLFIFVFSCLVAHDAWSQQYPLVHYTPKDGLVNSRVRKIYQDSKGRLYFLSFGGLSVYDGNRFRNYTIQNGLAADMVNDIIEVGDDSLLVATNFPALNVLVRGQMKTLLPRDTFCPIINYFLQCRNGEIYISGDEGLFILKQTKFEKLPLSFANGPNEEIFLGAIAEWNEYLVFTTNELKNNIGLYAYNKKTRTITDILPDSAISNIKKDNSGLIWISTKHGNYTLDTLSLKSGKLKFNPPVAPYRLIAAYPNNPFVFDKKHLWLIDKMKQIVKIGEDGSVLKIGIEEQLPGVNMGSPFVDRENITWICTTENGVIKLPGTNLTISRLLLGNGQRPIISQAFNSNDTTWFVLNGNKLLRKSKSETQYYSTSISKLILYADELNGKLIAIDEKSIYEAPIPSMSQTHISFKKTLTLPGDNTVGVEHAIDKYGTIIHSSKKGILAIREGKVIFSYPVRSTELIEGIKLDNLGRIWVAGRYMGIVVFTSHPEDPAHYLKPIFNFQKELSDCSPRSMIFDYTGKIWVGNRYNGVVAFKLNNDRLERIHQFQVQQGLTDNFTTSLACDSANNIIVGSPTGLDRLVLMSNGEYRVENITKNNNIFGSFDNIWVDSKGDIEGVMGAASILRFSPVPSNKIAFTPQLFIEDVVVNGQPLDDFRQRDHFKYSQRNISLNVAAPAFLNDRQVQYSYRLSGINNNAWSEPTTNASINLLNLSPGDYTLEVKAIFPSTPYAPREIAYHFVIMPPWWESWTFRVIAGAVLIAFLVFLIRFYYRRKMEKQRVALEKQKAVEVERTRIAHDIHDDLGAGLSTIRFLSEKVKLDPSGENTKTDIDKMQSTSYDLMEKMNEIIWAMNEKNDTLEDLLFYTRAYAKEYCEENGLQCNFDIPENIPLLFVSGEVRRNVFLAVKESLHNIVKHAYATEVRIQISVSKSLSIKVQDNGKGLESKKINLNGGNGLQIMQKRMGSIGGSLNISNQNGTSVEMEVPLNSPTP